jgi:ABC-type nitrate/sulfonate/bicarbonate transport system substrate-binding protein
MKSLWRGLRTTAGSRQLFEVILYLILAAFALGVSCAKKEKPSTPKISYAMPITVAAIPAYVALEKGFWKEEGLNVQAQMFSAGRLALDALLAKNAEVMSVSETPLMHAILQGNKIYIVATVTEHQEVKLIARRDHGIKTPGDLRGKLVATLPGTNSDYFMYEFLDKNGIRVEDVKITNMAPPDMVTAFIKGDIDAYFAWEPHIYFAQKQLPQESIVFPAGDLYYGRHCVAMNQDFVRAHPEVVDKLILGFLRAEKFVSERPEEAMAIVSKITGMDIGALKTLWPEYKVNIHLDSKLIQILDKEALWARSLAKSSEPVPNFYDYIYTQALSKERPSSVDMRR